MKTRHAVCGTLSARAPVNEVSRTYKPARTFTYRHGPVIRIKGRTLAARIIAVAKAHHGPTTPVTPLYPQQGGGWATTIDPKVGTKPK